MYLVEFSWYMAAYSSGMEWAMKEYWVNVYEYPLTKGQWIGNNHQSKEQAINNERDECLYCLHVKMKDKPGMSREYYMTFNQLQMLPYLKSFAPHIIGAK